MPKAIYTIWWDNTLGPLVGRSYPPGNELTTEEALVIFMGHGVNQEARVGYTKLDRGLVVSLLDAPNCIAVLLDDDDDAMLVERNLHRLVGEIDFNTDDWDVEVRRAYERLLDLMEEASHDALLSDPGIRRLITDMQAGRLRAVSPKHVLRVTAYYPEVAEYLGGNADEVARKLRDLESAGILTAKTFGRSIQCMSCGSTELTVTIMCPQCGSTELYNVYGVLCQHCGARVQTVIMDDVSEVPCASCHRPIRVAGLEILSVEALCSDCGTATEDPKITLHCALCGKRLTIADLLSATGLAYYLSES